MAKKRVGVLLFLLLSLQPFAAIEFPVSFYEIREVQERKEEFIKLVLPLIIAENERIMEERAFVEEYFSKHFLSTYHQRLGSKYRQRLAAIAKKYQIANLYDKKAYLRRIDTIPISLALSQSALESGWGKSLYAKRYNNIFGHYTFSRQIPARAVYGKRERIRVFDSLQTAVGSYMDNLNTHWAYSEFRTARQKAREQNELLGGAQAATYLYNYSEVREQYVALLQELIMINNFDYYDYALPSSQKVTNFVNQRTLIVSR